jgi:hypothetical protein
MSKKSIPELLRAEHPDIYLNSASKQLSDYKENMSIDIQGKSS